VFNLLAYLVQHPGRTVTNEELKEQLWPKREVVRDSSRATAVAQARKALVDTGQGQLYIQPVHRRGYRCVAPVAARPPAMADLPAAPTPNTRRPPAALVLDQAHAMAPRPLGPSALPSASMPVPLPIPWSEVRPLMRRALPRVSSPKMSAAR
jgi:DNA-binding winged helix-turn-helix (wHTH) protein